MGMAASQARYLGLTARKTNVEYEGQQINQARTALANQSANTFNDLLALEVPTAPSTQDFTTTQYSYKEGDVAETITNMEPIENDPDGYNYLVTHYHYSDLYTGIENVKRNPQVFIGDRLESKEVQENKIVTVTDPVTGQTKYVVKGNDCAAYDPNDADQKQTYDRLSRSYPEFAQLDPATLMTYKDASGNIHFIQDQELEGAYKGEIEATDYYFKSSKPTIDKVTANPVAVTTDPATGNNSYKVNGYECSLYDETDEKMKDAYTKAVQTNPSLSKLDPTTLYTYKDDQDGIHFVSKEDMDKIIAGNAVGTDYLVKATDPISIGNKELSLYDPTDKEQKAAYEQILKDWPESSFAGSTSQIYTWEMKGQRYFACSEDLFKSWNSAPDKNRQTENQNNLLYYSAQDVSTKIELTEKAHIDYDEKGRVESIRFEDSSMVLPVATETITDQAAYDDAMNQYNYEQTAYEKKLQDINAKTKKIQEQDRTLELRLRQLDTEQEALQTEMEAVKKVIDKNIESTFKTFQ